MPTKIVSRPYSKPLIISLSIFLLLCVILLVLELTNTTYIFHKRTLVMPVITTSQSTKDKAVTTEQSSATADQQLASQTTQTGDNKATANVSDTLLTPTGNFVSNHHPDDTAQSSVCTTTTGAACQIVFTQGSSVKSLPSQTTDRGGSTYWTWKVKDAGLTAGSWKVQARATLGTQVKVADDAINLEVAP